MSAAREAADAQFDVLIACAFNYEAHAAEFEKLGRVPVLKARMNPDLHMAGDLKNTGAGNLFVVFGEPDIRIEPQPDGRVRGRVREKGAGHPSWEGPRVTDCQGSPAYSFSLGFGTVPTCGP